MGNKQSAYKQLKSKCSPSDYIRQIPLDTRSDKCKKIDAIKKSLIEQYKFIHAIYDGLNSVYIVVSDIESAKKIPELYYDGVLFIFQNSFDESSCEYWVYPHKSV